MKMCIQWSVLWCTVVRDIGGKYVLKQPNLREWHWTASADKLEAFKKNINISLGFKKREIYQIYLLFGHILEYYSELKLAVAFHDANLQIWRGSEEHNYERYIFPNLGILYWKMGDFEQALEYHQRALEI
jgi:tetratricopeptide (TPR) repeat protein